jgi:hypothetical protein
MKVALVDNGSLAPAAHENLRSVAEAISRIAGVAVDAVSWKHSDRIDPAQLGGRRAWTVARWIDAQAAAGEREFTFIPFFISPQGAIGSLLRSDLDAAGDLVGGIEYSFTAGLSDGPALAKIVAERVRGAAAGLRRPPVIVVDHGGPSPASAEVRDRVADEVREILGRDVGPVAAASMESPDGPGFAFNRPLLADALAAPGFNGGDVVVAPLFLSPGRHAGPDGDLARIAREAQARFPQLRCHFAELVGTHPAAAGFLAGALANALHAEVRK